MSNGNQSPEYRKPSPSETKTKNELDILLHELIDELANSGDISFEEQQTLVTLIESGWFSQLLGTAKNGGHPTLAEMEESPETGALVARVLELAILLTEGAVSKEITIINNKIIATKNAMEAIVGNPEEEKVERRRLAQQIDELNQELIGIRKSVNAAARTITYNFLILLGSIRD